jgi:hemerythrin superfamily protein
MAMQTTTNPVELLKADHQKVKGLFSQFESAGEDQKPDIFKQIVTELQVHTKIEEEIFYPAVKKVDSEIAVEAEEEHNIVDWIISQMKKLKPDDEHYDAKFSTLKENVQHHIEEEEKEMFPEAEQKLRGQLDSLGQEMMTRKEALMKRATSSRSRSSTTRARSTSSRSRSGSRAKSGSRSR